MTRRVACGVAVLVLAIFAYAWVDGGREPVHEISQPIPVPAEPAQ